MQRMVIVPGVGGQIGIPDGHAERVLAKICKGLEFERAGRVLLPRDVRWVGRCYTEAEFGALNPIDTLRYRREIANVFAARWDSTPAIPFFGCMRFFGRLFYTVSAIHVSRRLLVKDVGAAFIPWPAPAR